MPQLHVVHIGVEVFVPSGRGVGYLEGEAVCRSVAFRIWNEINRAVVQRKESCNNKDVLYSKFLSKQISKSKIHAVTVVFISTLVTCVLVEVVQLGIHDMHQPLLPRLYSMSLFEELPHEADLVSQLLIFAEIDHRLNDFLVVTVTAHRKVEIRFEFNLLGRQIFQQNN